jgi:hypothetical protein
MDAPPFQRGDTFYNGSAIDAASLGGAEYLAREYNIPDLDYSVQGAKPHRTNRVNTLRAVRNASGVALLPKRTVALTADTPTSGGGKASGFTTADFQRGFLVDEFLPAAGAVANDIFYIVVKGVAKGRSRAVGAVAIAIGDRLYASSDGRLAEETGATLDEATNYIGRALSAAVANDVDVTVDVGKE